MLVDVTLFAFLMVHKCYVGDQRLCFFFWSANIMIRTLSGAPLLFF